MNRFLLGALAMGAVLVLTSFALQAPEPLAPTLRNNHTTLHLDYLIH